MSSIPEPVAVEARAKLMWGESPTKVLAFLQSKQVEEKVALALLEEVQAERAETIRAEGMTKIWSGALLALLPIGYYFAGRMLGFWLIKLFAGLIVVGAYGLVRLTNGLSMAVRPRAVTGDLSNAKEG